MTDNLLDLICQRFSGHPSAALGWRELLRVRDAVDRLLSSEIDRRQLDQRLPAARSAPLPSRPDANGVNVTRAPDVATGPFGIEGSERGLSPSRADLPAPQSPGPRLPDGVGDRAHIHLRDEDR